MAQTPQAREFQGTEVLDVSDAEEALETSHDTEKGELESEPELLFEIHFKASVFIKIGQQIQKALEDELKTTSPGKHIEFSLVEDGENVILRAMSSMSIQERCEEMEADENCAPDFSGVDHLFVVDTTPCQTSYNKKVPMYKRRINKVLGDESSLDKKLKSEEEANKCTRVRERQNTKCFNCGSTKHSMRNCHHPRNKERIKRAMMARDKKQSRYHVDVNQRFAHLRPGEISDNLREAMGLRGGELPFFFYRMRTLGYPPGWLEEAKVAPSGISVFNADGSVELKSDEEEGEIDSMNYKYDVSKIVDFPGFNVHPGPNYFDDYKHHKVPPMQPHQMKSEFIKALGDNVIKSYTRKKLKDLPAVRSKATANDEALQRPIPPADVDIEGPGPSQKSAVCFSRRPPPDDIKALDESTPGNLVEEGNGEPSALAMRTPTASQAIDIPTVIKESHEGTPILKFSPYDKLPTSENFKVGVSDVINFENLPNSMGKYEQLRGVLKNLRQKFTQMHADD